MDELKKQGKLLITDYELGVLKKYNINVTKRRTIDEVLFLIDEFLQENYDIANEEYDELDYVANRLNERKYYMEVNK